MGSIVLLALLELAFLFADLGLGFAFAAQAHFLNGIVTATHDVEAVQNDGGVREGLLHDIGNTLGQVHGHFLDLQALLFRYLEQDFYNVLGLGAADGGHNRAFLAVAVLVGQKGKEVILQRGLVYAQTLADVLRKQNPVGGVLQLLPFPEPAQRVLVTALQCVSIREIELTKGACRHRRRIQDHLLKKPRTQRSNGFQMRPADIRSALRFSLLASTIGAAERGVQPSCPGPESP